LIIYLIINFFDIENGLEKFQKHNPPRNYLKERNNRPTLVSTSPRAVTTNNLGDISCCYLGDLLGQPNFQLKACGG